jgi:hypothetical protein
VGVSVCFFHVLDDFESHAKILESLFTFAAYSPSACCFINGVHPKYVRRMVDWHSLIDDPFVGVNPYVVELSRDLHFPNLSVQFGDRLPLVPHQGLHGQLANRNDEQRVY